MSRRIMALLLACAITAPASPPDLTNGGVPGDSISFNMGAIGARGWVYHVREDSSASRQIRIKSVAAGSPAAGILAAGDVILGASGNGSAPSAFTCDARRALADAINDAEARDPATLELIRWRAGATSTVTLTLRFMGAYSATAPFNCPKSARILEEGLQFIVNSNEDAGTFSFGTLSLLAGNNPANPNNAARRNRAQTQARAMVPNATTRAQLMSDARDLNWVWDRGHILIMLAEYFLLTGDQQVLPGIEAYAVNIAKNTSIFGNTGHMYARKNPDGSPNGALGNGYGAVNSAALPCYLGLLLAKKCGLANPEIDPAIQRSARFFSYFAGKGAVPYGDHEAYWQGHEANGKSGLTALCLGLVPGRTEQAKFFARMAVAAASERGEGHTGAFFNYLWAPLGAAVGGEEAAASHFSRIRWMLDLNRKWDGSFDYDCLNGEGENSGAQYSGFRMSTAALLTYALPLRQLHITGKDANPALALDSAQVAAAAAADAYNPKPRTTAALIADLGNWSPMVHRNAAIELATRTIDATTLNQITTLADDPNGASRYGAILTLGRINDNSTAAARANTLVALLSDPDNHVRFMAAEAMRSLPQANKTAHLNHLLALCASQARPLLPLVEEDPMQLAHGRLCILLFHSDGGVIQNSLTGVDRNLLLPALRAAMTHPNGYVRSALPRIYPMLGEQETLDLADAFVDAVHKPIPCDRMFGKDTQAPTLAKLAQYKFAEVVPLSKVIINREDTSSIKTDVLATVRTYRGASTMVRPDPEIIPFLEMLKSSPDTAAAAQAVLDAIAADPSPVPATPLKSLPTISADQTTLTLPATQTTLRATGFDHAKGDSVFTWRKVHGKGSATFAPNGTAAAKDAAVLIDPLPGKYLFEVTMSDSRDLTEVSRTVAVTLFDSSGALPPNSPPSASPQSIAVARGVPVSIRLGGSDPEGYPLAYRIVTPPSGGRLTGTAPNLTYTASAGGVATSDSLTFEVIDSEGQVDDATVHLLIDNSVIRGAITWNPPSDITGTANVSTSGTLFASYTGHSGGNNVTVNGVTFAPGRIPNAQSSNSNIGTRVPTTGNNAYNTLLRSISWNYTEDKVTLTGLTPGTRYLIQIWAADNAETPAGKRSLVLGHGTNSVASLVHEPLSGAPGQFTTGTFTAAGTTKDFTIASYDYYGTPDQAAAGSAITNGMQIRRLPDSTPPFPNPPAWAVPPHGHTIHSVRMEAVTAYDASGVEYYFAETSGNHGGSNAAAITQTVLKATPVIITPPTATDITAGETLAGSTLTGGVGSVPGAFTFTAPATEPPVGTASHGVTFTPNDTLNYHAATTSVSVTVNAARTPFGTWASDPAHGLTAGVNDNPLDDPDSARSFHFQPEAPLLPGFLRNPQTRSPPWSLLGSDECDH